MYCVTGSLERKSAKWKPHITFQHIQIYIPTFHVYCPIWIKSDMRNPNIMLLESTGFMKIDVGRVILSLPV